MTTFKIGRDRNGNKVVQVKPANGRGFSIQTNGNLVHTDRHGVGPWTQGEVSEWVRAYGTARQRELMGVK